MEYFDRHVTLSLPIFMVNELVHGRTDCVAIVLIRARKTFQ